MVGTSFKDWCRYFQYNEGTNEDNEMNKAEARNALLVVATLIAAATFQAGVNPPGGVWQETKTNNETNDAEHVTGTAICANESSAYYVFLTANTLAFSTAVLIIMSITHKFPFKFEVRVAAISMIITYGSAIFAVTPDVTKFRLVLIVAAAPLVMRFLFQLFLEWIKRNPEPSYLIQAFVKPKPPRNERPQGTT